MLKLSVRMFFSEKNLQHRILRDQCRWSISAMNPMIRLGLNKRDALLNWFRGFCGYWTDETITSGWLGNLT